LSRRSPVLAIFGLELRTLFRDRRTLLMSVVLPVVLIPALLLVGEWVEGRDAVRAEARTYSLVIAGPDSARAAALLAHVTTRPGGPALDAESRRRFRHTDHPSPREALDEGELDVFLEALTPAAWRDAEAEDTAASALEPQYRDAPVLRVWYNSSRTGSREGARLLHDELIDVRGVRRDSLLTDAGFPVPTDQVARVDTVNIASAEEVAGARLGRFLTLILVGLMLLGGSAVATDAIAGEKERGTLMTLLTAAASRREIIAGKLLAIMAVAFGIALIQILNLWIFLGLGLLGAGGGFAVSISPGLAAGLALFYLPVVALAGGVLILVSAYARSYKEAQLYLTPVLLGMLVPTVAPLLPDLPLRSAILAVPIANIAVAVRDILIGEVHLPAFAVAWLVTAAAAAWVTTLAVRALQDENLVTGDTSREEFLGGPDLFRKRVFLWFLAFWAVAMIVQFNVRFEDLRLAILIHVGLVFLVFPLLVIRRYGLDPREALALRAPRPAVWPAVLVGAPAALLVGMGLFQLMDHVLPVPREMIESFGQGLLPDTVPAWQLILLMAIVPGIAEELSFRGVILHGLRRRFGPVALALVVGLMFGFFHFQIFRIPVTAFLGVLLTAVTLLTGSIFPAMLWHAINNAIAVFLGVKEVDVTALGWEWTATAAVVLGACFFILWKVRTPYPDLRPRGRRAGRFVHHPARPTRTGQHKADPLDGPDRRLDGP
jgi:sodium transport system permease protein